MPQRLKLTSIIARSLLALLVLSVAVAGIAASLTLSNQSLENRSSASTRDGRRTNWLGIAVDWQTLGGRPQDSVSRVKSMGTPWVYDWTAKKNLSDAFGTAATPMYWNCEGKDPTATFNTLLNWPAQPAGSSYYVMFLNEPDDSHAACSSELAAKQLNQFLTMRNNQKKTNVKVILGGGVHSTTWLKNTLATYRRLYGVNPDISGIHIHIYANNGLSTPAQLLNSLKGQLQNWRTFTTAGDDAWLANKEFWISETSVLSESLSSAVVASMLTSWMDHLATQTYVNRVYWFMDTVQSDFPFTWRFRSSALYQDDVRNTLVANAYKAACDKYCPRTTYPALPTKQTTDELQNVILKRKVTNGKYKTRWVTSNSQPNTTFTTRDPARTAADEVVGQMYKTPGPGRLAVHECYVSIWDNYQLFSSPSETRPSNLCNKKDELYKGIIGYVSAEKSSITTLPMQECFDRNNLNHYYLTNNNCSSYTNTLVPRSVAETGWVYGWLAPTTTPRAVPTPKPTVAPIPNTELLPVIEQKKTSSTGKKTRWTTTLSKPDATLTGNTVVGRLYKNLGPGRKPVHECYFNDWDDYILTVGETTNRPATFCPNTTPNWTETYKGVIGYAATNKSTTTPKAIQGCWDATNLNHAYTTKEGDCAPYTNSVSPTPTVTKEWLYGWIAN